MGMFTIKVKLAWIQAAMGWAREFRWWNRPLCGINYCGTLQCQWSYDLPKELPLCRAKKSLYGLSPLRMD